MTLFVDLNMKFLLILALSVFMSILNFMLSIVELSRIEHEKRSIISGPGYNERQSS